MTPHGDTATEASIPFLARVFFVAAVVLALVILGTTSAQALDLGQVVDDTGEAVRTVTEPVEEVVRMAAEPEEASDAPASEPSGVDLGQAVTEPVEQVVGQVTDTVIGTVEDTAGQTIAGVGETVSTLVDTTADVIDETVEIVGQIETTASSVAETTKGLLTETVDAVVDEVVPTIPGVGDVVTPDTEILTEILGEPDQPAEAPANPAALPSTAPHPSSQLVPGPGRTSSISPDIRPSPPLPGEPARLTAQELVEMAISPGVGLRLALPDAPSQIPPTPIGAITPVAQTGPSSPDTGPTIVLLAAALLLIGHIAPRLTEWLRLRPLIWRGEGLALAIERPG